MVRPPRSDLDPAKIFMHASKFHFSYQRLSRSVLTNDGSAPDPELVGMLSHPVLMLSAFASELYLKCLLSIERNSAPEGHNLEGLFNALNVSTKHEIDHLWDIDIHTPLKSGVIENAKKLPRGSAIRKDLRYALQIGAKGFMELRYYYENEQSDFLLMDFPKILRIAILKRCPYWDTLKFKPSLDVSASPL